MKDSNQLGKVVVFVALILVFLGCGRNEKIPNGVLSEQQMVNALMEVYIAEGKVSRLSLKFDSSKQVFDSLKSRSFERLSLNDSTFQRSINYYMDHPDDMERIYATVIDSLNLREQRSNIKADSTKE